MSFQIGALLKLFGIDVGDYYTVLACDMYTLNEITEQFNSITRTIYLRDASNIFHYDPIAANIITEVTYQG